MAFCSSCGTQVADGTTLCPACSSRAPVSPAAAGGGLTDNVAGMLAYVTIIPAIIFLVMAPYNRSRFVRFHAFQSIFFAVAWTVLWIALTIVGMMPVLGWATDHRLAAARSGRTDCLDYSPAQSQPGTDVQTAHHWRHGRKAGKYCRLSIFMVLARPFSLVNPVCSFVSQQTGYACSA